MDFRKITSLVRALSSGVHDRIDAENIRLRQENERLKKGDGSLAFEIYHISQQPVVTIEQVLEFIKNRK